MRDEFHCPAILATGGGPGYGAGSWMDRRVDLNILEKRGIYRCSRELSLVTCFPNKCSRCNLKTDLLLVEHFVIFMPGFVLITKNYEVKLWNLNFKAVR